MLRLIGDRDRLFAFLYQVPEGVTRSGFQREAGLIQGGERGRFAMPVSLRTDFDAAALRAIARQTKDGPQARRLLALAAIYEGATRTEAARIGGVTVQIIVESRTGAVAWAMRQRSVSRPRSSNRTCGFPASGFPTGFSPRPTAARRVRCVLPKQWAMADAPSNTDRRPSSPRGKASSEASGYAGVFQAHRQSPILGSLQSAPKARALSSASMTRPPRSYGPLRLPSDPPPVRRWGCQPPVETGLPR